MAKTFTYEQQQKALAKYNAERNRLGLTKAQMYAKENPYAVWAYSKDNRRVLLRFKNAKDAQTWAKATNTRLGSPYPTTKKATPTRRPAQRQSTGFFGALRGF